jgi:hypothetical protein
MGQIGELFKRSGGHFLLTGLIIGTILMWSIPIYADAVTITIDCEKGAMKTTEAGSIPVPDENDVLVPVPFGCPPPMQWPPGPPPPGAIQVNPTAPLPPNALCGAGMAHNRCSQQGYVCLPGKTCKDTWNFVTKACMCKCLP